MINVNLTLYAREPYNKNSFFNKKKKEDNTNALIFRQLSVELPSYTALEFSIKSVDLVDLRR
jgi:hypothetical protein